MVDIKISSFKPYTNDYTDTFAFCLPHNTDTVYFNIDYAEPTEFLIIPKLIASLNHEILHGIVEKLVNTYVSHMLDTDLMHGYDNWFKYANKTRLAYFGLNKKFSWLK